MSNNFENSESVVLKNVRLDYFDLFKPAPSQEPSKKDNRDHDRYRARAIFEKGTEAYSQAAKGLMEAATKMWGANAKTMLESIPANSKAVRNGNTNLDKAGNIRPEYADKFFIQASNKSQPQIVAQARHEGKWVSIGENGRGYVNGRDVTDALAFEIVKPFRGCYVDLKVTFVAGKAQTLQNGQKLPNQVYAQVEAVKFVKKGEAFGRGATSAEGFEDEEISQTEEEDENPF